MVTEPRSWVGAQVICMKCRSRWVLLRVLLTESIVLEPRYLGACVWGVGSPLDIKKIKPVHPKGNQP